MSGARNWTADEDAQLAVLAKQGLSYGEIAQILGRSDRAVELRRERVMPHVKIKDAPSTVCDALADKAVRDASTKFAREGQALLRGRNQVGAAPMRQPSRPTVFMATPANSAAGASVSAALLGVSA